MARWSEPAFRARVRERAQQLGLSLSALLERAGVSEDLFRKTPKTYGRNILTIERIADACEWTLAQVLGVDDPASRERRLERPTDLARIRLALTAADRTIGDNIVVGPERIAVMADLAGFAYDLLSDWSCSGADLPEATALSMVEETLRRRFAANADLSKS